MAGAPHPVVVTGLGLVGPHGDAPQAVFDQLMLGRSAVRLWGRDDLPPVVLAPAPFEVARWFTKLQLSGVDRVSQLAVAAAESARLDAQWPAWADPHTVGVYLGTGLGGATAIDDGYEAVRHGRRVAPLTVVAGMTNAPAANVALRAGVLGPCLSYSVACASSAVAIAEAAKAIACGDLDVALAGGSEALLVPGVVRAWQALQTLAHPDADDPSASCKPFDSRRSGFALGEGAAVLMLESAEHARARGARVYARLAGWGQSCDAHHLAKPQAAGQVRAITQALRRAGLRPDQVGYCNAHGTATKVGDVVEAEALRTVWAEGIDRLRVSSTKSMHGHLLGAAGALEALITVLAVHRQQLPPTAHCDQPDALCALHLVRQQGEAAPGLRAAISNSFAFGGSNAVLVFERDGV